MFRCKRITQASKTPVVLTEGEGEDFRVTQANQTGPAETITQVTAQVGLGGGNLNNRVQSGLIARASSFEGELGDSGFIKFSKSGFDHFLVLGKGSFCQRNIDTC